MITWIGFFISICIILIVARKNLPIALFSGAVVLGLFTLPVELILNEILSVLINPSIVLLAFVVGLIPMIGGMMKESGQIDDLVNNLRIGRKGLMASSPAIMGLLPMPGGALLSAPILDKGGEGLPGELTAAVNDWFRHLFIFVYPLHSALIVATKISNLNIYTAILHLFPFFLLALVFGYFFFIRKIDGDIDYTEPFSFRKLSISFGIILAAPAIDFVLKKLEIFAISEIALLIGVGVSFILSWKFTKSKPDFKNIFLKMRPWKYSLIILGMFVFLNIFKASNIAGLIAAIPIPIITLSVISGFVLGFATGRVILPASIVLPVCLTGSEITPYIFSLIYTAIFFGYIISPVHPCVSISCEYFKVSYKDFLKLTTTPAILIFLIVLGLSFLY